VSLGLRVTPNLKSALDDTAKQSGRSQSQEAEFRLERSFLEQRLMIEALELTYDKELAGILMVLGEAMKATGRSAAFAATRTLEGSRTWWDNPYGFAQATNAAIAILDAMKPSGEPTPPPEFAGRVAGFDMGQVTENLGRGFARSILAEIASEEPRNTTAIERAPLLRRALGSLANRIKKVGSNSS
jgi:hypothetical protein